MSPALEPLEQLKRRFGERMQLALNHKGWNPHDLSRETAWEYKPRTIGTWLAGTHIPHAQDIKFLAEVLNVSVDWLLGMEEVKTSEEGSGVILSVRGKQHDSARDAIFAEVRSTLWLQFRTGITFRWRSGREELIETIKKRKSLNIRLLICSPSMRPSNDKKASHNSNDLLYPIEYILTRRPSNEGGLTGVSQDIQATIDVFAKIPETFKKEDGYQITLEIRTIRHLPYAALYLADPETDHASALALLPNFHEEPQSAPISTVSHAKNMPLYKFFYDDYSRLWDAGETYEL